MSKKALQELEDECMKPGYCGPAVVYDDEENEDKEDQKTD